MAVQSGGRAKRQTGFTLLEVLIAVAILAISLMILVSTQSNAARMTAQADRILIGTMLARQKIVELEIYMDEMDGFSEQDMIEDDGDFEELFPDQYPEFRWRSEIRKVDISGASTGGLGDLLGLGSEDDAQEEEDQPGMPDPADLGNLVNMEQISEQLARFIREIRVTVYWEDSSGGDEVTITTHVIKPSGPSFLSDAEEKAIQNGATSTTTSTQSNSLGGK